MPITFLVPGPLRPFTDGHSEVVLPAPAATLRDALDQLGSLYPGIRDRIITEQGAVREHLNIFVGNDDVRYTGGLTTPLKPSAVISIVPAITGGSTSGPDFDHACLERSQRACPEESASLASRTGADGPGARALASRAR
jgi:molybdopterin converting factor small subunit